jgi:hypothetical protein
MLPVSSATATITADGYADNTSEVTPVPISRHSTFISNVELVAGKFYRNVPVTLTKGGELLSGSVTAIDGDIITSFGIQTDNTITIPARYTVTLCNVNIYNPEGSPCIKCLGNATIILEGTNKVMGGFASSGIQAGPLGSTLTIGGSGSLTATGGDYAAGIGSGMDSSCGNITITGGTITATGGMRAAGIGSGDGGVCGNITITNTVTRVAAYKGTDAPYSIGRGAGSSSCGTITIGGTTYYNGTNFLNSGETILSQSPFTYPTP